MCQAIRDGGRRCPIHQHQTIGMVKLAADLSGLNRRQTESLVREIRREGRNHPMVLSNTDQYALLATQVVAHPNLANIADIARDIARGRDNDRDPDGATQYAQRLIVERATVRGTALNAKFEEIAARLGITKDEVKGKFDEFFNAVDVSRGAGPSDGYNNTVRARAVAANLPYDRASVVALEKLYALPAAVERRRRVTEWHEPTSNSQIYRFGYNPDGGRLEVVFNEGDHAINAYHDVPQHVWDRLRTAARPGRIYNSQVRGHDEYMYDSREAAETDAYALRCASCGQFRAAAHTCPELVTREELVANGTPVEVVAAALEQVEPPAQQPEESAEVAAEEAIIEAVTPEQQAADGLAAEQETEEPTPVPADTRAAGIALDRIVIPQPQVAALDFEAARNPAETDATFNPGPFRLIEPAAELAGVAITPDAQFRPQALTRPEATETIETGYYASTVQGGATMQADVPEDLREIVSAAPPYMRFIVDREGYDNTSARAAFVYDTRRFGSTVNVRYDRSTGNNITTHTLYPAVGIGRAELPAGEDRLARRNTVQAEINDAQQQLSDLVANNENVVRLAPNATRTRRYTFDANLGSQPGIVTPAATAVRQAIRDNQLVVTRTEVHFDGAAPRNYYDDQGYRLGDEHAYRVQGDVAFRRNTEGVIEMVNTGRSLQCDCSEYRTRYRCEHINYVQRHMGNVYQQMLPPNVAAGRTIVPETATRDGSPVTHHRLMSAALRNRDDAEVVTAAEGDENGDYIRSNLTSMNYRNSAYMSRWDFSSQLRYPIALTPQDPRNPTDTEIQNLAAWSLTSSQLQSVRVPRSMGGYRAAVRRSDVELPIQAEYSGTRRYGIEATVTGNIRFAQQADGNLENVQVRSNTLRCTCGRFTTGGVCEHVTNTLNQSYAILANGSRTLGGAETNSMERMQNNYASRIQAESEVQRVMLQLNLSRDEAIVVQRDRAELERRERAAREEEQRQYELRRQQERAEQAQREAEERQRVNAESVAASAAYRERMNARWASADVTRYADNPEGFFDDYKAALRRRQAGEAAVPFRTENVTDGICADEPGARQFGIELEFDIKPGVDRSSALRAIGRELKDAGLTPSADQVGYHSAGRNNYAMWSFERDCTVDAELVSPLMKDTPEHWRQLEQALEIIKRNGGIATTRAGSHVHVSTASYESSTAKHVELLRTVNNNDDILYRMASNPERGKHRGMQWCAPNVNDRQDDVSAETLSSYNVLGESSHSLGLNFEGTHNAAYKKSNIEFRMWDSSLDAAVIQQQVVMSAAITDYAERNVMATGRSARNHDSRLNVGSGRRAEQALLAPEGPRRTNSGSSDARLPAHTAETFGQVNGHVASFFDKLFRRAEDRAAAASLFAVTNWQESHR